MGWKTVKHLVTPFCTKVYVWNPLDGSPHSHPLASVQTSISVSGPVGYKMLMHCQLTFITLVQCWGWRYTYICIYRLQQIYLSIFKDNFFQEQYIFKTKSSENLQSLLLFTKSHSDLNICQSQCTYVLLYYSRNHVFCVSVCVFVSSHD